MMLKCQIALLVTVSLLAGCGQVAVLGHVIGERPPSSEARTGTQLKAESTSAAEPAATPAVQVVNAVTLMLTPQAVQQIADDVRFKQDALLDAIQTELRARKLLDDADARVGVTVEVAIDDFAVRRTSNAVVFGYVMSDGTLDGEIRVRDADGQDMQVHRIEAQTRLTTAASGENADVLAPLYRCFAVMTADRLAGVTSKPSIARDQLGR